jgi:NTE family protein
MASDDHKPVIGLIMLGGGARAAYQVGVLKAIAEILPPHLPNPFPVITGTSAGAINATALAVYAHRFREAVKRLNFVWKNFEIGHVFRSDPWGVIKTGAHWLAMFMFGGMGQRNPTALFDRAPLRQLLAERMPCEGIQDNIDAGYLHALSVTCSGYSSGESVTFYQGVDTISPWRRARRMGCAARITIDHLMASSAIPFIFQPEHINREYFGDGSMRHLAPLSPALHLGADRLLVIGVRHGSNAAGPSRANDNGAPTIAQIVGHVLNTIFLDSLDVDIERLHRINRTLEMIPLEQRREAGMPMRRVEVLMISPSKDLAAIAARHAHHMPRTVRFLLRGIGATRRSGGTLLSYLLFEKPYCRELINLGYADAMARREELERFFSDTVRAAGEPPPAAVSG